MISLVTGYIKHLLETSISKKLNPKEKLFVLQIVIETLVYWSNN